MRGAQKLLNRFAVVLPVTLFRVQGGAGVRLRLEAAQRAAGRSSFDISAHEGGAVVLPARAAGRRAHGVQGGLLRASRGHAPKRRRLQQQRLERVGTSVGRTAAFFHFHKCLFLLFSLTPTDARVSARTSPGRQLHRCPHHVALRSAERVVRLMTRNEHAVAAARYAARAVRGRRQEGGRIREEEADALRRAGHERRNAEALQTAQRRDEAAHGRHAT